MSTEKVAKKIVKEGSSVFRILNGLRHFGVGTKITRNLYHFPDTYWVITRCVLSKDQNHGKVYGRQVWRGLPKPHDTRIGPVYKKDWKLVEFPDYQSFKATPTDILERIPKNTQRTC